MYFAKNVASIIFPLILGPVFSNCVVVYGDIDTSVYTVFQKAPLFCYFFVQGGPKNGLFFRLDNFVTVSPRNIFQVWQKTRA